MLRVILIAWLAGLFLTTCLLAPGLASAATVAELIYDKTPYTTKLGGKVRGRVAGDRLHSGQRARLLVLKEKSDDQGQSWLQVRLPQRPNAKRGWLRASQVSVYEVAHRLVIDRSKRTLYLYRNGKLIRKSRIVVGAPATPTPIGLFAIWDRYRPGVKSPLHPWVLELTAHSEKLRRYEGGEGRVALHGMQGSLSAPLGSAVSHGCMRLPSRLIRYLANHLSLGTPVRVRP